MGRAILYLRIRHRDIASQRQGARQSAQRQLVLLPETGSIAPVERQDRAFFVADVNRFRVHVETGTARHVTRPKLIAVTDVEAGHSALISDRANLTSLDDRQASDVGNAFEFVVVASARAKQLLNGCTPRVEGSTKLARRAQQEVLAGLVRKVEDAPAPEK